MRKAAITSGLSAASVGNDPTAARSRIGASLAALGLFAALAVIHTWPLATAPGHFSRNDNADTMLNEWTLAWDAHEVVHDPRHMFDANMFYPEKDTLAYSEHLLVPAVIGAPLLWAGASPILVYNLLLLLGLTLTGWAMCQVVSRWTGDRFAGILSGILIAFNASTLTSLPHLQAQHGEFLPLALLTLDALLSTPRVRHALVLAWWFALQALTSYYSLIFAATALVASVLVRGSEWWGERARRVLPLVSLSGGLAAALVLPFLVPYCRVGQVRSLPEVAQYSASWHDYLATPARVHYPLWSAHWFGGTALFPGAVGLALTAFALGTGVAFTDRRARMALAFGVAGLALSFGPALPGYATLYAIVPPLQGIRAAARFGSLVLVAVAVLAGFGLAAIRTRWRAARWLPAVTISVLLFANLDAFAAPLDFVRPEPISSIYARLQQESTAVVVEFPFYPPDHIFHNAVYLLNSTIYWHPLLNGYSGIMPESYVQHYRDLQNFPDARAIAAVRAAGVTRVVVHYAAQDQWFGRDVVAALRRCPDLRLLAADDGVGLYALVPTPRLEPVRPPVNNAKTVQPQLSRLLAGGLSMPH